MKTRLMHTKLTTCTLSLLALSAMHIKPILAGAETQLRVGMNYSSAREMLIDGGWQPKYHRWQDKKVTCRYNDLCNYAEIKFCLPTGTGHCGGEFTDINGRTLYIETGSRGGVTKFKIR